MVASTSIAVPSAQHEDGSLLRAVLGRNTHEVKDYTVQYDDHFKLVNSLGIAMNAIENKAVLDVLVMRKRRLDAALVKETNAIEKLNKFCVAEKSASQAQSAAAVVALAPSSGAVGATTTTTVPPTPLGTSSKKIMKRKLPEPNNG
jgi:hypothetical protein